jgi:hypothetical protein
MHIMEGIVEPVISVASVASAASALVAIESNICIVKKYFMVEI